MEANGGPKIFTEKAFNIFLPHVSQFFLYKKFILEAIFFGKLEYGIKNEIDKSNTFGR